LVSRDVSQKAGKIGGKKMLTCRRLNKPKSAAVPYKKVEIRNLTKNINMNFRVLFHLDLSLYL